MDRDHDTDTAPAQARGTHDEPPIEPAEGSREKADYAEERAEREQRTTAARSDQP